jgi:hypothetical protein
MASVAIERKMVKFGKTATEGPNTIYLTVQ